MGDAAESAGYGTAEQVVDGIEQMLRRSSAEVAWLPDGKKWRPAHACVQYFVFAHQYGAVPVRPFVWHLSQAPSRWLVQVQAMLAHKDHRRDATVLAYIASIMNAVYLDAVDGRPSSEVRAHVIAVQATILLEGMPSLITDEILVRAGRCQRVSEPEHEDWFLYRRCDGSDVGAIDEDDVAAVNAWQRDLLGMDASEAAHD